MQKSSSFHQFILETRHKYFAHFWPCPPKTFRSKFYLPWICINIWKISLLILFVLLIQPTLDSRVQGGQTHLTTPTQNFFNKLSILTNLIFLLEHDKSQAISSFCCRDTENFKILKSDWLMTFFLVSGTKFFPDIGFMQDDTK